MNFEDISLEDTVLGLRKCLPRFIRRILRCIGLRGRASLLFLNGLIADGLKLEFAGRQVAQR